MNNTKIHNWDSHWRVACSFDIETLPAIPLSDLFLFYLLKMNLSKNPSTSIDKLTVFVELGAISIERNPKNFNFRPKYSRPITLNRAIPNKIIMFGFSKFQTPTPPLFYQKSWNSPMILIRGPLIGIVYFWSHRDIWIPSHNINVTLSPMEPITLLIYKVKADPYSLLKNKKKVFLYQF